MIVMKFGGSSLESANAIERVASIVRAQLALRPVVVVSAMGKTTNGLIAAAEHAAQGHSYLAYRTLDDLRCFHVAETERLLRGQSKLFIAQSITPKFRELHLWLSHLVEGDRRLTSQCKDEILSYGERLSSEIVSAAFHRLGINSVHLDARRVIQTDNQFGHATPLYWETYAKLRRALPYLGENTVAVLGGFIGATEEGVTTTLGRGGSDLTASIVGAGICAEEIQIWTDVDGMLTCDPRILDGGHRLRSISYREAEDMAKLGAKVLHPSTVAPAIRQRIPLTIRNTRRPDIEGTKIASAASGANGTVKSIAGRPGMTIVHLDAHDASMLPTITEGLSSLLAHHNIAVELVQARPSGVSFAVETSPILPQLLRKVDPSVQVRVEEERAIVALVGDGVGSTPAVTSRALLALRNHVCMYGQGSSLCAVCFAVPEAELHPVVEKLHREFFSAPDPELFVAARAIPEAVSAAQPSRGHAALSIPTKTVPAH